MKVLLSPQRNPGQLIFYTFSGDTVTANMNGAEDTFDFTNSLEIKETTLPFSPVIRAERIDGELYVELINCVGPDPTEEENFPEWKEV